MANILLKAGNKHHSLHDDKSDKESDSSTDSSDDDDASKPSTSGPTYYWTIEGQDEFILLLCEWPRLTSNVLAQDMGFRIDWSIEEPADAVLTRFYIPLREAHHSVKTNKGSFFVQAPRTY